MRCQTNAGYWYKDFFLTPDMMTAYFAIDPQTMENGCIKMLKGSHKLGRIDHIAIGDQQGADPERVELCLGRFEEVYFVAEPGDALFFHALTLHSSRGNFSQDRRLAFASAFTRENNVQWKDPYIPCFPFETLEDDAIIGDGTVRLTSEEDKVMLGADVGAEAARKDDSFQV